MTTRKWSEIRAAKGAPPLTTAGAIPRIVELERRVVDFAATWHTAAGHDGRLLECNWSTCLGLLTGDIKRGADLDLAEIG